MVVPHHVPHLSVSQLFYFCLIHMPSDDSYSSRHHLHPRHRGLRRTFFSLSNLFMRIDACQKHICVKTFLEFSGQFPPPSIAQNSTTRLFQRIATNLKAAMNLAVSIGNYPATQCPLCQIALDLIEQVFRLHDLCIYGLTLRQ